MAPLSSGPAIERPFRGATCPISPEQISKRAAEQAGRERLIEDLERRLEELETLDDSDIGSFTALDWFFCIAGSVVIPALALWWFAS